MLLEGKDIHIGLIYHMSRRDTASCSVRGVGLQRLKGHLRGRELWRTGQKAAWARKKRDAWDQRAGERGAKALEEGSRGLERKATSASLGRREK